MFEKGIGLERESVLFCTKFSNNSMLKTTERSSRGLIYNMAESKSLTISCHFCQALISFKMATKDKFEKHMEVVHEVHLDFDLLLALHMLGEEERASLVRAAKGRAMSSLGVVIGPLVWGRLAALLMRSSASMSSADVRGPAPLLRG